MAELWPVGAGAYAVAALAVFLGTLMQRLAGQGFGMVAAPMLALVAPGMLPASILLVGAAVGLGASSVDRAAVARDELPPGFAGRTLGAVVAAWIATRLADPAAVAVVVAAMVYLGILLSVIGIRIAIRPASLFSAGFVAGIMGTLTAVGAPPMALLYQHEPQRRSAAMQNTFFFWGMLVSIAALALAGLVTLRHIIFATALLPAALLALAASQPLARRVARAEIRPWALALAGLAATVLILGRLA